MIKRLVIAATTATAFLFGLSAHAAVPSHSTGVTATVNPMSCPAPLHEHSDGTCWP